MNLVEIYNKTSVITDRNGKMMTVRGNCDIFIMLVMVEVH